MVHGTTLVIYFRYRTTVSTLMILATVNANQGGSEHTDLASASCSTGSSVGDSVGELVSFPKFGESCCSKFQTCMFF